MIGRKHQVLKIRKTVQKAEASNGLFSSNSGRFLAAVQPGDLMKRLVNHNPYFFTVEEAKLLSSSCFPELLTGYSLLAASPVKGLTLST